MHKEKYKRPYRSEYKCICFKLLYNVVDSFFIRVWGLNQFSQSQTSIANHPVHEKEFDITSKIENVPNALTTTCIDM